MSTPAEGVKDLLVAAGVGTFAASSGWGIYVSREPTDPHTVVTVYDTGGRTPNPKWLINYPAVQVRVRGAIGGYQAAYAKAVEAQNALLGLPAQVVNGDNWDGVIAVGGINQLGYDSLERPLLTMNFTIFLEPASGTYRQAL